MRRRTLLASLASASAILAGCQTRADDRPNTGDPTTDEPPRTDQPTTGEPEDDHENNEFPGDVATTAQLSTQQRTLSLFPVEYRSRDGGRVRLTFESSGTAEQPARLRAELENTNDFSNVFRLGDHPPFEENPQFRPVGNADESVPKDAREVYLAPLPDQSLPEVAPDVERGPDGTWRLAESVLPRWLPKTHRLDAGESVSVTFAVVGEASGTGPFATTHHENDAGRSDHSLTLAAWDSEQPGPTGESRFEGETFPALPHADETAWFHDAAADSNVFLRPGMEQTSLPADLSFTLVNHAEEPASGNPYYWALYKLADGEWRKIAPQAYVLPMSYVAPGDTERYDLRVAHGEIDPCADELSTETSVDANHTGVGHLGGGTYAFECGMNVDDSNRAAVFEVDAPPVAITPEDGVEASRDGETVAVTSPEWNAGHGRGVLTVSRAERADRTVVPEVAARRRRFRNTLPFFEDGVTTVELRTSDNVARLRDDQPRRFSVRGQAYTASSEIVEE